ncbi:MAG: hypothetical protein UF067_02730 [Paludibacteraceae bacterium]|jgi:hypothetical protein|nr:hypothetical protein [Paludibacteraceae bacterium]MBQ1969820.1 hypothetical protein [Paludibacteraceae bacterium]MEE1541358.1 hypothetical protein [Paludibacteraceae bacterium]
MRTIFTVFLVLILSLGGFVWYRYYFVFAEGVKSGQLNYVTKKGYIFKTYEGKLIQSGVKSSGTSIQSNEFVFSIEDERVAKQLELASGKYIDLHYNEYISSLPWRGMSQYVVDSVIAIHDEKGF